MTVALGSRIEITLDVFERVAWRGEPVRIEAAALERADDARKAFLRLLDSTRRHRLRRHERLRRSSR